MALVAVVAGVMDEVGKFREPEPALAVSTIGAVVGRREAVDGWLGTVP